MKKEEYLKDLKVLDDESKIGLQLFFLLNNGDIKKVNLGKDLLNSLKKQFIKKIKLTFNEKTHFSLKNIVELSDESLSSEYYYFDSENIYEEIKFILELTSDSDDINDFVMDKSKYSNIKAILLKIGTATNNVILYKHHYPINVMKKTSGVNIFKEGNTFKEVSEDIFKIDINFDLILVNNHIVVNRMNILESKLGYRDRILTVAQNHLEIINTLNFIEDLKSLEKAIESSRWAKKLNKVQNSPVLDVIKSNKEKVVKFIKNHPSLNSINISSDDKLELNTQKSVERFLKLLDDDYLFSQLTEKQYDTNSKNTLS